MYKSAQTKSPIHPLLSSRWSPRAFDVTRAVSNETIISLVEAARWAPSSYGGEPWRFIVCNKANSDMSWDKAFACLVEFNQKWAANAPLLIMVCAETAFAYNGKQNPHAFYDSGAAALSLVLEAENQALRAHQMSGFDPQAARKAFSVPDGFECVSVIAVGYQAEAKTLPDDMKDGETAARTRKPLGDCFFNGAWGKAVDAD